MTNFMEKDIKDYREKELKAFVIGNILLILVGTGLIYNIVQPLETDNVWKAVAELFGSSVLLAIIYIYVFIFDAIIPGKIKERIIWPIVGLPGNRIFTIIRQHNKDDRFTTHTALKVYSGLYQQIDAEKDKKECANIQNEFWYVLYQKYEGHAQVYASQRDFLLCRDMTAMMLWIFIGEILLSWYLKAGVLYKLWIVFAIEFFLVWFAARVKGERFVYNVIAKDLARVRAENEESGN